MLGKTELWPACRLDTHTLIEECPPPFKRGIGFFNLPSPPGVTFFHEKKRHMRHLNYKALALGTVLGFLIAVVPSCGTPTKTCGASNCNTGCCNSSNVCVTSPSNANNNSCGTSGNACVDCTKNDHCRYRIRGAAATPENYNGAYAGLNGARCVADFCVGAPVACKARCLRVTTPEIRDSKTHQIRAPAADAALTRRRRLHLRCRVPTAHDLQS